MKVGAAAITGVTFKSAPSHICLDKIVISPLTKNAIVISSKEMTNANKKEPINRCRVRPTGKETNDILL